MITVSIDVVWKLRRRPLPNGILFLVYLLLYAGGRFVVTFWSSYHVVALGLNQAQLISLVALVTSGGDDLQVKGGRHYCRMAAPFDTLLRKIGINCFSTVRYYRCEHAYRL